MRHTHASLSRLCSEMGKWFGSDEKERKGMAEQKLREKENDEEDDEGGGGREH